MVEIVKDELQVTKLPFRPDFVNVCKWIDSRTVRIGAPLLVTRLKPTSMPVRFVGSLENRNQIPDLGRRTQQQFANGFAGELFLAGGGVKVPAVQRMAHVFHGLAGHPSSLFCESREHKGQ
jgi:hypothetical protein